MTRAPEPSSRAARTVAWLWLALVGCHGVQHPPPLAPEAAPASSPPDTDLAPSFKEPLHGFVFLAPLSVGPGDTLHEGRLEVGGRSLRLAADGGSYTSRIVQREQPFTDLLPSWNVAAPDSASFRVDIRVGRAQDGYWSPWLLIGDWGTPVTTRYTLFDGGKVVVDVFESEVAWDRAQLRIEGTGGPGELEVHRTSLVFTDRRALPSRLAQAAVEDWPAPVEVRVPVRSQRLEDPRIAGSVCSPTSVAMVMELNGVKVPTASLAATLLDPTHEIYGNWSRAVQGAFCSGVPGSLVRVSSWNAVAEFLKRGVPLVASIRAEPGELRGAPYTATEGHLLVVTGIGPAGQVRVNDPAAYWPGEVRRTYLREDLEKCWFEKGGVAYAFDPVAPIATESD
ncbi:MAG: C39 family peptidase [Planctomycetota bacterium]